MKVLVTGGAGYIGSHTVRKILAAGHEVVIYDNLSAGFRESLPAGVDFVFGDVRDKLMLSRIMKDKAIEAVVHFAGKLVIAESLKDPLDYYQNNTLGVIALAQACLENHVDKIVFSSTGAVYGDANTAGELIKENDPTGPLNPYAHSKLMSEKILADIGAAGDLRTVALRYFNAAGAADDGHNGQRTKPATHIVQLASQAACGKKDQVFIFGTDYGTDDGSCVRDYIHVEDLADLHVLALQYLQDGGKSEVFNCGYGRGFSVREVIASVKKVSAVDFAVHERDRRAGDAAFSVADSAKVQAAFAWSPKRDNLELICRSAYQWESQNRGNQ